MRKLLFILLLSAACAPAFADPLESIRPLAVEAINSGAAEGVLDGDTAKFIYDKMGATAPLRVKVTRLIKYKQEGCARLNAQFKQDNVVLPGEAVGQNREVNFQFNYCEDGKPPRTEGKEFIKPRSFYGPAGNLQK